MKYFAVTAACGHVGRGYYTPKTFGVKARNGREAARIAREIPRVKHDYKYAILEVRKLSKDDYDWLNMVNEYDPFLKAYNVHCRRNISHLLDIRPMKELSRSSNLKKKRDKEAEDHSSRHHGRISRKAYVNRYVFHDDSMDF